MISKCAVPVGIALLFLNGRVRATASASKMAAFEMAYLDLDLTV